MILLGLIPLRWSVRTPKGQQVYQEIKVATGLWSLEIQKKDGARSALRIGIFESAV